MSVACVKCDTMISHHFLEKLTFIKIFIVREKSDQIEVYIITFAPISIKLFQF